MKTSNKLMIVFATLTVVGCAEFLRRRKALSDSKVNIGKEEEKKTSIKLEYRVPGRLGKAMDDVLDENEGKRVRKMLLKENVEVNDVLKRIIEKQVLIKPNLRKLGTLENLLQVINRRVELTITAGDKGYEAVLTATPKNVIELERLLKEIGLWDKSLKFLSDNERKLYTSLDRRLKKNRIKYSRLFKSFEEKSLAYEENVDMTDPKILKAIAG